MYNRQQDSHECMEIFVEDPMKSIQRKVAIRLREIADNIEASDNVSAIEIGEHHLECEFLLRVENGVHEGKITFNSIAE